MPAPRHESVSAQAFTEVTRACLRLTFALCWSLPQLSSYSTNGGSALVRRSDSDPVRRQGPERGSTGEGGRPRSFLSGPPQSGGPESCSRPDGKAARPLIGV